MLPNLPIDRVFQNGVFYFLSFFMDANTLSHILTDIYFVSIFMLFSFVQLWVQTLPFIYDLLILIRHIRLASQVTKYLFSSISA